MPPLFPSAIALVCSAACHWTNNLEPVEFDTSSSISVAPEENMSALVEMCMERRPVKKPRACSHCHVRKVRCDAWQVGLPCTRCRRRQQDSTCVLVAAPSQSERTRYVMLRQDTSFDTSREMSRWLSLITKNLTANPLSACPSRL